MIQAKLGRHPGNAWMMFALRPRHGFAMMRTLPASFSLTSNEIDIA
jgi:hypothetical protein